MRRSAGYSHWVVLAGLGAVSVGLGGCASTSGDQRAQKWTGSRAVAMHQPETGEKINVTYGRDGVYDQRAMEQVAQFFRDRRTGDVSPIDPRLLDLLVTVRERLGLNPGATFQVTSGYRSPITNAALARRSPNVAENSYHLRGQAVDFHIDGVSPERIAAVAGDLGLGGYAWYPHTGHVHLDTGPVRTWTPRAPRRGGGWIEVKSTSQRSAMAVAALAASKHAGPYKPVAGKPVPAGKPGAVKAVAGKPVAGKPAAVKTGVAKPAAAKNMTAAKPVAAKTVAAKPAAAKPAAKVQVALRK
jgi:uncharacterized protein YcbK (DUF882 family)